MASSLSSTASSSSQDEPMEMQDEEDQDEDLARNRQMVQSQTQVSLCTGALTLFEMDRMLLHAGGVSSRVQLVDEVGKPETFDPLVDWLQERIENSEDMMPGELCQPMSCEWVLCKALLLCKRGIPPYTGLDCYCMDPCFFMPGGCEHQAIGFTPCRPCNSCSKCMRCDGYCKAFPLYPQCSCQPGNLHLGLGFRH